MDIRYYEDPETGEPQIYEHGVSEDEVEYVLRYAVEDRPGRDDSRHAIGQTVSGRCLRVIYVRDPGADSIFVVTAYDLRGKELQAYRRRRRRRKGQ